MERRGTHSGLVAEGFRDGGSGPSSRFKGRGRWDPACFRFRGFTGTGSGESISELSECKRAVVTIVTGKGRRDKLQHLVKIYAFFLFFF